MAYTYEDLRLLHEGGSTPAQIVAALSPRMDTIWEVRSAGA